eukprot:3830176-Prymnesium_polylepis.5
MMLRPIDGDEVLRTGGGTADARELVRWKKSSRLMVGWRDVMSWMLEGCWESTGLAWEQPICPCVLSCL